MSLRPVHGSLCIAAALLASCATPKAVRVEESPKPAAPEPAAEGAEGLPSFAGPVNDGIRLPDMMGMPDDEELRSVKPSVADGASSGVIARPPGDPAP